MKYTEKLTDANFSFDNEYSVATKQIEGFFDDIHTLPPNLFKSLYIKRSIAGVLDEQILNDIKTTNVAEWKKLSPRTKESDEFADYFRDPLQEHSLIQIISPIGSGKTTFIHYFLKYNLPKIVPKDLTVIPILFDVRQVSLEETSIINVIFDHINNTLNKHIGGNTSDVDLLVKNVTQIELSIYRYEACLNGLPLTIATTLQAFQDQRKFLSTLYEKDRIAFLQKKIAYIKQQKKVYILFILDNIDQHAYVNLQNVVFTLNQISRFASVDTIITLRDATYRQNITSEAAGAFHNPQTYILTPPNIDKIGKRRLKKSLNVLKEIGLDNNNLSEFLRTFMQLEARQYAPEGKKGKIPIEESSYEYGYIWPWLENLGNCNIRIVLSLLKGVLKSRHLTSTEFTRKRVALVNLYSADENINIKRLKTALVSGKTRYYSEEFSGSFIVNLFDHADANHKQHYTYRLKLLQLFSKLKYFKTSDIYKILQDNNYLDRINTDRTILLFLNKHLLSLENKMKDGTYYTSNDPSILASNIESNILVTPNGYFHLNRLIYDDIYLDEMKYDTMHTDDNFKNIFIFSQNVGYLRKLSTLRFIEYIIAEEKTNSKISANLGLPLIADKILSVYNERKRQEGGYWKKIVKIYSKKEAS